VRSATDGYLYLYIDGSQVGSVASSNLNINSSGQYAGIGAYPDQLLYPVQGLVELVGFYTDNQQNNHAGWATTRANNLLNIAGFATAGTPFNTGAEKSSIILID